LTSKELTRSFILDRGTAKLCVKGSNNIGSVDIVGLVHGLEVHLQHRVATQYILSHRVTEQHSFKLLDSLEGAKNLALLRHALGVLVSKGVQVRALFELRQAFHAAFIVGQG